MGIRLVTLKELISFLFSTIHPLLVSLDNNVACYYIGKTLITVNKYDMTKSLTKNSPTCVAILNLWKCSTFIYHCGKSFPNKEMGSLIILFMA